MIENQLIRFREAFWLTKVRVHPDFMMYKVKDGAAEKYAAIANDLIDRLGLNLVAMVSNDYLNDAFIVKSSEVEL